jgi:hypothetical protein
MFRTLHHGWALEVVTSAHILYSPRSPYLRRVIDVLDPYHAALSAFFAPLRLVLYDMKWQKDRCGW